MSQQPATTPLRALVIHHVITLALVIGALSLSVWGYLTFRKRDFFYDAGGQVSPLEQQLERSQRQRISLAIKTYYQIHNNWPLTLDQLVEQGLLEPADLRYPSPKITYTFEVKDGRPVLEVRREDQAGQAAAPAPQDSAE
jgi:hypothetical protein